MNQFIKKYLDTTPHSSIGSSIGSSIDSMKSIDFTYSDSDQETSQLKLYQIKYNQYIIELDSLIKKNIEELLEMDFNPKKIDENKKNKLNNEIEILKHEKIQEEEIYELILNDPESNLNLMNKFIKSYT